MHRKLRVVPDNSNGPARWIRGVALALAVTGFGLTLGTAAPDAAKAEAAASGTSMSVPLAPNAPETYVVKKGDTLWDIAGVFLKYPWYWPEIWYVNPQIQNPHWIYPGDVLRLIYVDGKPRVTVETAGATRLSPEVRIEPLAQAVRTVPWDILMRFVGQPSVLDRKTVRDGPYVVGFRDRHIVGGVGDEAYAKGLDKPAAGTRYSVIHPDRELRDPDNGDLLGYMGIYAATVEVINTTTGKGDDRLTHLAVVASGREIQPGDKVLPALPSFGDDFTISAPKNANLDGQLIAVKNEISVGGKYSVFAINRGKRDGLVPGNVVAIFARGVGVRDYTGRGMDWTAFTANYRTVELPKERSGTLLIFDVRDRMSYGIVVESVQPMRIGDFIKHPDFGHDRRGESNFIR